MTICSSTDRKIDEQGNKLKFCTICKIWKLESEFYKDRCAKDGLSCRCKECALKRVRAIDRTEYTKKYNDEHKEEHKTYYQQHREQKLAYQREYNKTHRQRKNKINRQYYQQNKETINKLRREQYDTNSELRLNCAMSRFIYQALKHNKAEKHWGTFVDYSLDELKQHIEQLFDSNMNWDNMGEYWEIDHIIPKGTFSYNSPEDKAFKICWSLANLRPLEKIANRSRPKDGSDVSESLKLQILNQK